MARSKRKPSSPEEIALRRAQLREGERAALRDPRTWGVNEDQLALPANDEIAATRGMRRKIVAARRQDGFDALYAGGGLSVGQHQAARRLMRDWAERQGIQTSDTFRTEPGGGEQLKDHLGVSDRMLAAGDRIDGRARPGHPGGVFNFIGKADVVLLTALVEQQVYGDMGVTTWWDGKVQKVGFEDPGEPDQLHGWRGVVVKATGEGERHAQGAVVRMACENLRLAYDEIDRTRRPGGAT